MKFKNPKIEKLYKYLAQISNKAYKDQFLITNIILSKEESKGQILENYIEGNLPPKISLAFILKKFSLYIAKNFMGWIFSVVSSIFHWFAGQNFSIKNEDELILVDTYFVTKQILNSGEFKDIYFPGLSEYLTKQKKKLRLYPKVVWIKTTI